MEMRPAAGAILVAAGSGRRARSDPSDLPKQFALLGGRPLFSWSMTTLLEAGCAPVVVVVPEAFLGRARAIAGPDERTLVVPGGDHRQDSVARGLEAIEADMVVVHDAARPLASPDLVRLVVAALDDPTAMGAIPGLPVSETVKLIRPDAAGEPKSIDGTIDRERLYLAQTPQAFRTAQLRAAHRRAREGGFHGTDDAQLVERFLDGRVLLVEGEPTNVKVTHERDLLMVESMIGAPR